VTGDRTGRLTSLRSRDAIGGLVLLAVAAAAWLAAGELPSGALHRPGPGLFPKSLAVLIAGLAILLVIRSAGGSAASLADLWPDRGGVRRIAVMLVTLLAYAVALEPVGYLLTTAGAFVILLRWVSARSWCTTGAGAALASAGSYLLFARWLMVSLPPGLWAP
jgi:putative tricarboxylic transport membrane protein